VWAEIMEFEVFGKVLVWKLGLVKFNPIKAPLFIQNIGLWQSIGNRYQSQRYLANPPQTAAEACRKVQEVPWQRYGGPQW